MYDLILRDATLVSSEGRQVADVAIRDGRIAYIGPRPPRDAREEVAAMGKFLMPGVIDTAVQFDPNSSPQIWERESRAAVTGGITTVIALPGGEHPVLDRQSAARRIRLAQDRSWCNFALWAAAHPKNAEELKRAAQDGLIVGTLAHLTDGALDERLPGSLPVDALRPHSETPAVLGVQLQAEGDGGAELLSAVRAQGGPVHLVHVSTAAELNLIDPVRADLLTADHPLTASVTPHHLFLSTEDNPRPTRTRPPVRPEHDRRTLWTAIKRGRLDCIASDHHPNPGTEEGLPGSELLFPLMLSSVRYGRLNLELLVSLCSEAPARIFGLERKGRIEKGADADLVLFSEGEVSRVTPQELMSGAGWSPYMDREAAPKPELVLINGRVVARRGALVGQAPTGRCASAA